MTMPRVVSPLACLIAILGFTATTSNIAFAQDEPAPPESSGGKAPIAYVDRSITVPEMTLAAELDLSIHHVELGFFDATGSTIDIWGRFGITDWLEVEAVIFSLVTEEFAIMPMNPFEFVGDADWGTARLGVTARFLKEESVEMAGRFRLLIDNNATIGFNGGLPIVLRIPNVFRFDTGINFMGLVNAESGDGAFGIFDVSANPSAPAPGIPLRFTFQPIDFLFLGFHSGFGVLDVEDDDTIFIPLGFHVGGSFEADPVLVDVMATAGFPLFGLPALPGDDNDRVISELWQIGLSGTVHYKIDN